MILVIGGRSRTGQELIRLLRAAGAPLRILTRSGETAADPDAVPGDLAKPDTLDAAMIGTEKVFLLCSAAHDELAWHRNAIDAAARAGVRHLVRSSILGADPDSPARFIRHHGQADEHLRASGVPSTILRPNMYMHNVTTVWPASIGPDGRPSKRSPACHPGPSTRSSPTTWPAGDLGTRGDSIPVRRRRPGSVGRAVQEPGLLRACLRSRGRARTTPQLVTARCSRNVTARIPAAAWTHVIMAVARGELRCRDQRFV